VNQSHAGATAERYGRAFNNLFPKPARFQSAVSLYAQDGTQKPEPENSGSGLIVRVRLSLINNGLWTCEERAIAVIKAGLPS